MDEIVGKNSNQKVYVATDDVEILMDLKNKYPDNVVTQANSSPSRRTSEGIKFALYEMLILAGAKTLYASYFSTFSLMAHCIGKNEIIVLKK